MAIWENRLKHQLYRTYNMMKVRCYNKIATWYNRYWALGIKVCERWLWLDWFSNFIKDMWERPEWYTLDRIDTYWNYEPNNCKWSNYHQQNWNTKANNKCVWVYYNKKEWKWVANIWIKRKRLHLWYYNLYEDAVTARKKAELYYNIIY